MTANQRRVCLFAQYHPRQRLRPPLLGYLRALQSCGYQTFVACSGPAAPPEADRAALEATGASLLCRPNAGLDFGAWQHLVREGCADGADRVLLANDSVFGPFRPLGPVIDRMEAGSPDVWGLIESRQRGWHLQSWFLQFTGAAFRHSAIKQLFAQPFDRMDKDAVIERGELALGEAIRAAGLRTDALIKHRDGTRSARHHTLNMMHLDWAHNMLALGMPFIKVELLRLNPMRLPWTHEWDGLLRTAFGVDTGPLNDYLYDYTGTTPPNPGAPYPVPLLPVPIRLAIGYVFATRDHVMALRNLRGAPIRFRMPPEGLVPRRV
ncbi:MAG: rhamnan synthesis F family protein [Acetobacteraceae bacterium]|nr:rhamnan synthesis F family protein [Acetobacteraceae bacterium]